MSNERDALLSRLHAEANRCDNLASGRQRHTVVGDRERRLAALFREAAEALWNLSPSMGLTNREAFAMSALQGFCANPSVFAPSSQSGWHLVNATDESLVRYCYELADHATSLNQEALNNISHGEKSHE